MNSCPTAGPWLIRSTFSPPGSKNPDKPWIAAVTVGPLAAPPLSDCRFFNGYVSIHNGKRETKLPAAENASQSLT